MRRTVPNRILEVFVNTYHVNKCYYFMKRLKFSIKMKKTKIQ